MKDGLYFFIVAAFGIVLSVFVRSIQDDVRLKNSCAQACKGYESTARMTTEELCLCKNNIVLEYDAASVWQTRHFLNRKQEK